MPAAISFSVIERSRMNFQLPRRVSCNRQKNLCDAGKDFATFPELLLMFLCPFKYNSAAAFFEAGNACDFI
jgi:hypothetical protein